MVEWSQQHQMMRSVLRQWLEKNLEPATPDMEEGRILPFELMRKLYADFGMRETVRAGVERAIRRKREGKPIAKQQTDAEVEVDAARDPALGAIVSWEMSRINPGFCLSFGATLGLAGSTIVSRGTPEQIERWGLPVMSLEKIAAWAVTEPGSGSDAFAMQTRARRDGDSFVLDGSKIFITNAPYADLIVVYARLDDGTNSRADKRNVHPFVVERGTPGLEVSKPMKKMGMKSSPTGEVFLHEVRVPRDQMLGGEGGGAREQVKEVFAGERTGSAPMSAGIIERCLDECLRYTAERRQFGRRLADFQLVQQKVANMYVALNNVQNVVLQQIAQAASGKGTWKDACAAKLYATEAAVAVAMDAVQLLGGYGYLADFPVERLARDAKLLVIGGGTSEIQTLNLAKALYRERGVHVSLSGGPDGES